MLLGMASILLARLFIGYMVPIGGLEKKH